MSQSSATAGAAPTEDDASRNEALSVDASSALAQTSCFDHFNYNDAGSITTRLVSPRQNFSQQSFQHETFIVSKDGEIAQNRTTGSSPQQQRTSLKHGQSVSASSPIDANISPATQSTSITPGQAPYEWWDLVAQDAARNEDHYQALKDSRSRWSFEPVDFSRSSAPSPRLFLHGTPQTPRSPSIRHVGSNIGAHHDSVTKEVSDTTAFRLDCVVRPYLTWLILSWY